MPFVTDDEATPLTPAVAPVLAFPALPLPALPELTLVRLTRSNPPSPLVMTMQVIPHFVSHFHLLTLLSKSLTKLGTFSILFLSDLWFISKKKENNNFNGSNNNNRKRRPPLYSIDYVLSESDSCASLVSFLFLSLYCPSGPLDKHNLPRSHFILRKKRFHRGALPAALLVVCFAFSQLSMFITHLLKVCF